MQYINPLKEPTNCKEKVDNTPKFRIQWQSHPTLFLKGLCTMLEHHSLVDLVINCGTSVVHAHKCILAANSSYFREQFEQNNTNQIIVNGLDFVVMKSIIEFIYSGETSLAETHLKYFIAAAKLFQIDILKDLFADNELSLLAAEEVGIPQLQFVCKSPKYSTINPFSLQIKNNYNVKNSCNQNRVKNIKRLRVEAEKACNKEAQASQLALSKLHKGLANETESNTFIIEESCTETTVENFIPHDESDEDNLQNFSPKSSIVIAEIKPTNDENSKNKKLIENDIEIIFETSDGETVNLTNDVTPNFSKNEVQYRVVDENGNLGQPQELQVLNFDINKNDNQNQSTIEKIARTVPEEYIDPSFRSNLNCLKQLPTTDATSYKDNYETLIMQSSFDDRLYDVHSSTSKICEPENLTVRAHGVEDNPFQLDTFSFNRASDTDNNLNKLIDLSCNGVDLTSNGAHMELDNEQNMKDTANLLTMKSNQTDFSNEKSIIFEPSVFFFDLSRQLEDQNKNIYNNS